MKILEQEYFHSGGGFNHLLIRLEDGRILSIHTPFLDIEISHNSYESIQKYLDDDEFGYEFNKPNYNLRNLNILSLFENIKK